MIQQILVKSIQKHENFVEAGRFCNKNYWSRAIKNVII